MNVIFTKDYEQASRAAARIIAAQVNSKPDSVLGLATGSSPIGTYKELIRLNAEGDVDFSRIRTVNLDEYVGIGMECEQSYVRFMNENLFDHINIDKAGCNIPNGHAADIEKECERYDSVIRSLGGVDVQLLGIGHDGHIGFNEPSDHFSYGTNCVELEEMTIEANKRFFDSYDAVPKKAITMGIYDIMAAKKVVLIACGKDKAAIIAKSVKGPITPMVPASILQYHPDCTVIVDEAAAEYLK